MAKVTCQICKKKIEKSDAFRLPKKQPNHFLYYCSEVEYENDLIKRNKRDDVLFYFVVDIMEYEKGQVCPPYLKSRIKELNKLYDYDIIKMTLEANRQTLNHFATKKEYENETHMVNYLMALVKSEINSVYRKWKKQKEFQTKITMCEVEEVSLPIDELQFPSANEKGNVGSSSGIMNFLDEGDL